MKHICILYNTFSALFMKREENSNLSPSSGTKYNYNRLKRMIFLNENKQIESYKI